jgi:hypothetical protein
MRSDRTAWRIGTPEGIYLILTRFDDTEPEQHDLAVALVREMPHWESTLGDAVIDGLKRTIVALGR